MPKYFPLPARIITVAADSAGVDIQTVDTIDTADTALGSLDFPEAFDGSDKLALATLVTVDTLDGSDAMSVGGTITADDTTETDDTAVGTLLVPEATQIGTALADVSATLNEYIVVRPRIADALIDVGEVVAFDGSTGRGVLRLSSANAGTGLVQASQAAPTTSTAVTPGSTAAAFRASNSAVSPNELLLVCGWKLSDIRGVRWKGGIGAPSDSFIFGNCQNASILQAANATLYATLYTESQLAYTSALSWDAVAALRTGRLTITSTVESEDSADVPTANPITGASNTQRIIQDPFDVAVSSSIGRNLWCMWWQDEPLVTDSLNMVASTSLSAWVEFTVNT
jgi:hypothetical protein